jgi:hypothetical protein
VFHLLRLLRKSQEVLVKPSHSLVKGLLLGPFLDWNRGVTTDSETVLYIQTLVIGVYLVAEGYKNTYLYAAKQVDLVRLTDLPQDLLGLVALLCWKDGVRLGGGDGQRAGNGSQLVLLDKGGVGDVADLDAVLVVADNVL